MTSSTTHLVGEADAPPLLVQVDDDARPALSDVLERHRELPRAVALHRAQHLHVEEGGRNIGEGASKNEVAIVWTRAVALHRPQHLRAGRDKQRIKAWVKSLLRPTGSKILSAIG